MTKISSTKHIPRAPAIIFKNFSLSFNQQIFFKHFNWEIAAGKITCLLGPSGVGKSTLLRGIADVLDREHTQALGEIFADDQLPLHDRITYMAQSDLLLPWLTVLENALLGSRLRGEIDALMIVKATALLTELKLGAALQKYPAQLSGGMRQRTALARTLLENKSILLMDEPFSSVDAITRLQLQNLAATLLTGKTTLLVTHDPLEALRLADVIYVLTNHPAQMSEPFYPTGIAPRNMNDSELLQLHQQLLQQLSGESACA